MLGRYFNSLSANPIKWLKTLKQFVDNLPTNCLGVFNHFVGLALKGLRKHVISEDQFSHNLFGCTNELFVLNRKKLLC